MPQKSLLLVGGGRGHSGLKIIGVTRLGDLLPFGPLVSRYSLTFGPNLGHFGQNLGHFGPKLAEKSILSTAILKKFW